MGQAAERNKARDGLRGSGGSSFPAGGDLRMLMQLSHPLTPEVPIQTLFS